MLDGVASSEKKKAVVNQTELCPGFGLWLSLWLLSGWHLSKELTIWLLRWWGGYGWFQEKISLRLAFRENKFLQGNTERKKFLHWQKYLSRRVKLEKNVTPLHSRKKILSPEAKSSVPLSKVKWSAPKELGMFSYNQLQVETPFWLNLCEASYFLKTLLGF